MMKCIREEVKKLKDEDVNQKHQIQLLKDQIQVHKDEIKKLKEADEMQKMMLHGYLLGWHKPHPLLQVKFHLFSKVERDGA